MRELLIAADDDALRYSDDFPDLVKLLKPLGDGLRLD
jgi:hypothetical protein